MAKQFGINEIITTTGIVNGVYKVSDLNRIRFVTEEAGPGNTFIIRARISGESSFSDIATLVGDVDRLITIDSYDELQIECTVFATTTNRVKLLGTGYQAIATGIIKVADATERLALSPSDGDPVLQLDNDTLYVYDLGTDSWIIPNGGGGGTADSVTFDNTGTNLAGADLQATTEELDIRTFGKQYTAEDVITLSAGDITNKYIILSSAPTTKSKTRVTVIEGVAQEYGTDFIVTADDADRRLSWDGLGLEILLSTGDKLLVSYN